MRLNLRRQAGDTIVEVLLAIAIISMVLGGAYAATNRSIQTARAAQERGEALKVAETQIERLKYNKDSDSWIEPASTFCVRADGITLQTGITDIVNTPNCRYGNRYNVSIRRGADGVYTITVLWQNITGTSTISGRAGYDQLQLFYRI